MQKESESADDTMNDVEETTIGDNNSNPLQVPTPNGEELSLELQKLHELLKVDMEQMLIKPLEDRMSKLENSQANLEKNGTLISAIKSENIQLRKDCNQVKNENVDLRNRPEKIENKLRGNNVILNGVEDQVWELIEITWEKANCE